MYAADSAVILYTRKPGDVPDFWTSHVEGAAESLFAEIMETGLMTTTDWAYDPPRTETFDVDMAALCRVEQITRPGVDRANGQAVGTWSRVAAGFAGLGEH